MRGGGGDARRITAYLGGSFANLEGHLEGPKVTLSVLTFNSIYLVLHRIIRQTLTSLWDGNDLCESGAKLCEGKFI